MADAGTVHLTEQSFDEALVANQSLMMVDFWAEWCGPCRAISPVLEDLARSSGGKVTLAKVNVDENPGLAARYGIRSIPTILFVKDGKGREQVVGAGPKPQIQKKLGAGGAPQKIRGSRPAIDPGRLPVPSSFPSFPPATGRARLRAVSRAETHA